MWKIIQGELDYMRPFLFAGFILSLFTFYFSQPWELIYYGVHDAYEPLAKIITPIVYTSAILCLIQLYSIQKENRIRQQSLLPVSRHIHGISRIARPLTIMLYFFLLLILYYLASWLFVDFEHLGSYFIPENTPGYYRWEMDFWRDFFKPSRFFAGTTYMLGIWCMFVYVPRLWTELPGRILLGILLLLELFLWTVLPMFNSRLAYGIGDWINAHFTFAMGGIAYFNSDNRFWMPFFLSMIVIFIIHISFLRRRSFLS
ncbi:MAG TPA: hypothetical protein VGB30_08220 [bacterium]